jgi:uncharacterized protein (DUF983 family)
MEVLVGYLLVVGWVSQIIVAGILASNKNRSVTGWCLLTVLFGAWMVGILLALKPLPGASVAAQSGGQSETNPAVGAVFSPATDAQRRRMFSGEY